MREELDQKLTFSYPNLYKQRNKSMQETAMCWGFCCGDGWYDIINDLSEELEPLGVEAVQVKEKFGTLRFYINRYPKKHRDKINKAINKAEELSAKTCEVCGEEGKLRGGGWLKTLCDLCNNDFT